MIGERIAERRKILGLSQEQLADLIKVHRNYIGNVERGEKKATVIMLCKISLALNLKLVELFDGY